MLKKILKGILAALIFVSEVLGTLTIATGVILLGVAAISSFITGNIWSGIFAIWLIIGFILILWEWCHSAW